MNMKSLDIFDNFFNSDMKRFEVFANVSYLKDSINIDVNAPGFERDQLNVFVDENKNTLTVSAKVEQTKKQAGKFDVEEWKVSSFKRSWIFPSNALLNELNAKYVSGVLSISIPLNDNLPPKTYKVEID